jgi:hypothetical protein
MIKCGARGEAAMSSGGARSAAAAVQAQGAFLVQAQRELRWAPYPGRQAGHRECCSCIKLTGSCKPQIDTRNAGKLH